LQLIQRPAQGLKFAQILAAFAVHLVEQPLGLFHLLQGLLKGLDDLLDMALRGVYGLTVVATWSLRLLWSAGWTGRGSLGAVRTRTWFYCFDSGRTRVLPIGCEGFWRIRGLFKICRFAPPPPSAAPPPTTGTWFGFGLRFGWRIGLLSIRHDSIHLALGRAEINRKATVWRRIMRSVHGQERFCGLPGDNDLVRRISLRLRILAR
jgi:hypothetical protein